MSIRNNILCDDVVRQRQQQQQHTIRRNSSPFGSRHVKTTLSAPRVNATAQHGNGEPQCRWQGTATTNTSDDEMKMDDYYPSLSFSSNLGGRRLSMAKKVMYPTSRKATKQQSNRSTHTRGHLCRTISKN